MSGSVALPMDPSRALRRWLVACVVAVFLAVMVGGITRLTESGLSITEWRPVSGVLPPTTEAGWQDAYGAGRSRVRPKCERRPM